MCDLVIGGGGQGTRKPVAEAKYWKSHLSRLLFFHTIITLVPCALNGELQHFILRFYKIFLLCGYQVKEGIGGGWKEAQRQGDERVTLQITSIMWPTNHECTIHWQPPTHCDSVVDESQASYQGSSILGNVSCEPCYFHLISLTFCYLDLHETINHLRCEKHC